MRAERSGSARRLSDVALLALGVLLVADASGNPARQGTGYAAQSGVELGTRARCEHYAGLPAGFGAASGSGLRSVPAGEVDLGSEQGYLDERPLLHARLDAFAMDRHEVTVAQFATFVAATGHRTTAERAGGGAVFFRGIDGAAGWRWVDGANWRRPEGPAAPPATAHEPVVQVSRTDAQAFAHWLGRRLPTEAEWEAAAAGSVSPAESAGRTGLAPANTWQGPFPYDDTGTDGYRGRAPVGCFAANPLGLHDLLGNVWEWTADAYLPHRSATVAVGKGDEAGVIKGGSFLCAPGYCVRYRRSARHAQEADLTTSHLGFRTVRSGSGAG